VKPRRFIRCKAKPSDWGWAIIREALQAEAEDLPDLLWLGEHVGLVITWR
jgi:hypothetical protein